MTQDAHEPLSRGMLSIRHVSRRFRVAQGTINALVDLSFDVQRGEFFVLVGSSGSGKTTLLRCVAGLEIPDAGEIRLDGAVMSSDTPRIWVSPQRRQLGMVFQSYAVWPHLTVFDNVALPLREGTQRIERREIDRRVRQVLELVELADLADRSATLLSGGQQQRVALARAIAVNSRMILMDEPLSNLDARLREEVRERIRELAKQLGSTVLYVTHDQVEAMAVADRIALLRGGELLQVGSPTQMYTRPMLPEIASFFGHVNWLDGVASARNAVQTPIGTVRVEAPVTPGKRVLLGVRPEALVPYESAPAQNLVNALELRLLSRTFVGDQVHARLSIGEYHFAARARSFPDAIGASVRVAIDPADVMVFPAATTTPESAAADKDRTPLLTDVLPIPV